MGGLVDNDQPLDDADAPMIPPEDVDNGVVEDEDNPNPDASGPEDAEGPGN